MPFYYEFLTHIVFLPVLLPSFYNLPLFLSVSPFLFFPLFLSLSFSLLIFPSVFSSVHSPSHIYMHSQKCYFYQKLPQGCLNSFIRTCTTYRCRILIVAWLHDNPLRQSLLRTRFSSIPPGMTLEKGWNWSPSWAEFNCSCPEQDENIFLPLMTTNPPEELQGKAEGIIMKYEPFFISNHLRVSV